jgi:hypothetical protein
MGVIVFDGLIRGNIYLDFNKFNFKMEKRTLQKNIYLNMLFQI